MKPRRTGAKSRVGDVAAFRIVREFKAGREGKTELVDVTEDGVVKVRLKGACSGCPGAAMTLKMGVERLLKKRIPEVVRVENTL